MKPRARLLIPVWGLPYLRRLVAFGLPALAASGNLPALAEITDLRLVFLTTEEGWRYLGGCPIVHRLGEAVPIDHVSIDDLTARSAHYAAPLTYAYWRGIEREGEEMVNTHFIFMNGDFVLADGSLRSLGRLIVEGRRVVLTSNLRVDSNAAETDLLRGLDPETGVIAIPPRRMVALSLHHQHPTQIAKTMTSGVCHSVMMNQLFWRVDENTLISHHYLPFMLALRPERIMREVRGFCDYTFVPELCPSAERTALDDSDDFCMIEMQDGLQEFTLLRLGSMSEDELCRNISSWTTREHRRFAVEHQIVFHAADITAEARSRAEEIRSQVVHIDAKLSPEPMPIIDHPFWIGLMRGTEIEPIRPLTPPPSQGGFVARLRRLLVGRAPFLPEWHPDHLDYRELAREIMAFQGRPERGRILYLHGKRRVLVDGLASEGIATDIAPMSVVFSAREELPDRIGERRGLIIAELDRDNGALLGSTVRVLMECLSPGGRLILFLHDPRYWTSALALAYDMRYMIPNASSVQPYRHTLRTPGGERRRPWLQLHRRLLDALDRGGARAVVATLLALPALAVACRRNNREGVEALESGRTLRDTSSFTLIVRK